MQDNLDLATELARLSTLSAIDYDQERKAAAQTLGVRLETLDAEVQQLRPSAVTTKPAGATTSGILEPVKPWPEPVDGAALLTEIHAMITRFMVLPKGAAAAVSLWVAFSHAHDFAEHSPLLAIESPEKRCGKTTMLLVISQLVPIPLPAANITTAFPIGKATSINSTR